MWCRELDRRVIKMAGVITIEEAAKKTWDYLQTIEDEDMRVKVAEGILGQWQAYNGWPVEEDEDE